MAFVESSTNAPIVKIPNKLGPDAYFNIFVSTMVNVVNHVRVKIQLVPYFLRFATVIDDRKSA